MAETTVDEFGNILNSMLQLKPPGVSGSKIKNITELCVENVQSESLLMQRLYTHFKKAPGSHKLGVLYVVDSIVRAYIDEARRAGQDYSSGGPDGTFAAGVAKVTDMLSSLMNDIMQHAPEDTKEKIKKLVDIWARGSTFPADLLDAIRSKHFTNPQTLTSFNNPNISTPDVAPPNQSFGVPATTSAASSSASILAQLAQLSRQSQAANVAPSQNPTYLPPVALVPSLPLLGLNPPQPYGAPQGTNGVAQQTNLQNFFPGVLSSFNNNSNNNDNKNNNTPQIDAGPAPFAAPSQVNIPDQAAAQQGLLAQLLLHGKLHGHQLQQAIEILGQGLMPSAQPGVSWSQAPPPQNQNNYGQSPVVDNYNDDRRGPFSPERERFRRGRSRSRSPPNHYEDSQKRNRRSPIYGEYDGGNPSRGGDRDIGRRGRGRSGNFNGDGGRGGGPGRFGRDRSASPGPVRPNRWGDAPTGPNHPKFIDWDHSLKPDRIKVFSRTLFVGGVASSEADLRKTFEEFGEVQSCIVNYEKRHAFIKMKSRHGAVRAKEGMEANRHSNSTLRTRWGVGFGPRDCSDYATGISIIPLQRLTEADRRWLLNADFGGTGGVPTEAGMVIEEPDIEIGQGVSSKEDQLTRGVLSQAISRRMQTDNAGQKGPRSSNNGNDFHRNDRGGRVGGDKDGFRERGDRFGSSGRRDSFNGYGGGERENGPGAGPPTPGFGGSGFPPNMGMPFHYPGQQPNQY